MPTSTEVAGIHVSISADIGRLGTSLTEATSMLDSWARRARGRNVKITIDAKKGKSWDTLESDLTALVQRVTRANKIPIELEFHVPERQIHGVYENLYRTIRTQVGERTRNIPINVKVATDIQIGVDWYWIDGPPPGDLSVGVSGGGGTPPKKPSTGGRRKTATADVEVEAEVTEPTPTREPKSRKTAPKGTTSTVKTKADVAATVPPAPETKQPPEQTRGAPPTGTTQPRNAAQRASDERIAANTAAAGLSKTWETVTRQTLQRMSTRLDKEGTKLFAGMAALPKPGTGTAFERELGPAGKPTGAFRYQTPEGRVTALPAGVPGYGTQMVGTRRGGGRLPEVDTPEALRPEPRPRTEEQNLVESILARVSEAQGKAFKELGVVPTALPEAERRDLQTMVNQAIVGEMQTKRTGRPERTTGVDWRSSRFFDQGESVDPVRRQMGAEAFLAEQAEQEQAEWERLREIFGATDEDRERIIKNWAGKSERWGKLVSTFGEGGIKRLATALGGVLEYTDKEADKSLEAASAALSRGEYEEAYQQMAPIRQAAATEIRQKQGGGARAAQRLARLRGGAGRTGKTITPSTPAEARYMAASLIAQDIALNREFQGKIEQGKESAQQAQATREYNDVVAAYIAQAGERPIFPEEAVYEDRPTGRMKTRKPTKAEIAFQEEWQGPAKDVTLPEMVKTQVNPGVVLKRQRTKAGKQEPIAKYRARIQAARDAWEEGLAKAQELSTGDEPKARRLYQRAPATGTGANVALTPEQETLRSLADMVDELESRRDEGQDVEQSDIDAFQNAVDEMSADMAASTSPYLRGAKPTRRRPSQPQRIARAEGLTAASLEKLQTAPPEKRSYYASQLARNKKLLAEAKKGTTAERGLTGEHRRVSEEIRANVGFCQYCGEPFIGAERGHGEHAIPRSRGGGAENIVAACKACNEAKGDQTFLEFLQNPRRRQFANVDPVRARAEQAKRFPGRMYNEDVIGLRGASPRGEGLPIDVPDVRDIAEAMGLGRGGFGTSGVRSTMRPGSRQKMLKAVNNSKIEKVYALIGDRYVDEAGRELNNIREVIELATDPKRTTANKFALAKKAERQLTSRLAQTGSMLLGISHGVRGHTLGLSETDIAQLAELQQGRPGALSGVIDPSTKEGMRFYGMGPGGVSQRAMNVGPGMSRGFAVNPAAAQAAMPTELAGLASLVGTQWDNMTDSIRMEAAEAFERMGTAMPEVLQTWVNRQRGVGVPPNAAAIAAGLPPLPPGGAFRAAGMQPLPAGLGAGAFRVPGFRPPPRGPLGIQPPPGQQPPPPTGPDFTRARVTRGIAAIEQEAIQAGVPESVTARIRQRSRNEADRLAAERVERQQQVAERVASTPVRALSTAIGQFVAQRVARGGALAEQRRLNLLERRGQFLATTFETAGQAKELSQAQLAERRRAGTLTPEDQGRLEAEIKTFGARETRARGLFARLQPEITKQEKKVAPLSTQLLNLAALTPAVIGGGIAFQIGMQIAQAGLEQLGKIAGTIVEDLTGFSGALATAQQELSQAAFPTGDVRAAVAQRAGAAGLELTPEQRGIMEGRTAALLANQRAIQQRDMLRFISQVGGQNRGAGAPLDAALLQPTGGFLGTFINATPPFQEVIGNELERLNAQRNTAQMSFLGPGIGPIGMGFDPKQYLEAGLAAQEEQAAYLASLNEAVGKAGGTAQFATGEGLPLGETIFGTKGSTLPQVQQAALLDEIGAPELAAAVRSGAVAIKDETGAFILSLEDLEKAIGDAAEGLSMPSAEEAFAAMERPINAALMGIQDAFTNAINEDIPIADWRAQVTNRALPFGLGLGTSAAGQAAFGAFAGRAVPLQARQEARFATEQQQVMALPGVNDADVRQLAAYGEEIRGIQIDLANRQLAINTAAYNQQLKIAQRSLADIRGLNDQTAAQGASQVGLLERQNLELDRQNTALSRQIQARGFILSQQQINMNLAVAGFSAPGETGAESAARLRQAQRVARVAQKDLDDQRKIFENQGIQVGNQIKIVDEQNLRALNDAIFAVRQTMRQHAFEKYAEGAAQMMGVLQREADFLGKKVDEQINRYRAERDLGQQLTRDLYLQTGQILTDTAERIERIFRRTRKDYDKWLGDIGNGAGGGGEGGPGEGQGQYDPRNMGGRRVLNPDHLTYAQWVRRYGDREYPGINGASGLLGSTTGTTQMTVGEAGMETVAVLRNPRQVMAGLSGGGSGMTILNSPISFGSVTVRSEDDIAAIARSVESILNRRAGLLGMLREQ